MVRRPLSIRCLLVLIAPGTAACSTLYDFDALGPCGSTAPEERLRETQCHSVYVDPFQRWAIVTQYSARDGVKGGVYRVDLADGGQTMGTRVYPTDSSSPNAAGIA